MYPDEWPQFFTATISEWKPLLEPNEYKDIIIQSLQFLVTDKRINLNAFVIMNNHLHVIWQAHKGHTLQKVQQSFMKFTAQKIKFDLIKNNPVMLKKYKVASADREYRFWKRRSLGIELFSPGVFTQKLEYIHNNPVKAGLCKYPEQYYYSSAKFYHLGVDDFGIITHYE
jgi:REP element-mobilizing transposase RayT